MKPYYIVSPRYTNCSAGIRVLYKLKDELITRGYQARMSETGPCQAGEIPVVPDIFVNDGSLGRVARWMLNAAGVITGNPATAPRDDELVFYYLKKFDWKDRGTELFVPAAERETFFNRRTPRASPLVWLGKGAHLPMVAETAGMIEITRAWPARRDELAIMLNAATRLYTYDSLTGLIDEARLCGCPVRVLYPRPEGAETYTGGKVGISFGPDEDQRAEDDVALFPAAYDAYVAERGAQIDRFVRMTQETL